MSMEFPGMGTRHIKLMKKAIEKSGNEIQIPFTCSMLSECFKEIKPGVLSFWYNIPTQDGETTSVVLEGN